MTDGLVTGIHSRRGPRREHPTERAEMRTDVASWLQRRTFHALDYDPRRLLEHKRCQGPTASVVLPALDEERTVGAIVAALRRDLVEALPLIDEVVVVDSGSSDRTAAVAEAAGARVVHVNDVLPERGHVP